MNRLRRPGCGRRNTGPDPDQVAVRNSASRIGWQVTALSAALVLFIVGLVIVDVLWQSTPSEQLEAHPNSTRIYVDAHKLLLALTAIGVLAAGFAGLATWIVARRAITPLGAALRMQRTFVADTSHELRTPLTVLSMRIQQLERRLDADDAEHAIVAALRSNSQTLIDIVNDLLEAAAAGPQPVGWETSSVASEVAVRDIQLIADRRSVRILQHGTQATVAVPPWRFAGASSLCSTMR